MKNNFLKIFLFSSVFGVVSFATEAFSDDLTSLAGTAGNGVIEKALKGFFGGDSEEFPDWLKRTEFEHQLSNNGKPQFGITTVQPILEKNNNYYFNQTRIAYGSDGRTTGNIGLGFRHLAEDEKIISGLNYFYDFEGPYGHQRSGVGAELKSSAFEMNTNYYHPHTGWRDAGTIYEEHALKGCDLELGTQVPYLPWAWGFVKGYQYNSEVDKSKNITGSQYSLRLRPVNNIEFEGGYNNSNGSKPDSFLMLRYRIGFNEQNAPVKKKSMFSATPFEYGESVKERIYEKVRRSNNITLERRVKGAGGSGTATATVRVAVGS